MATIQILQSSDTQLSNGKYYAIGTIEDLGQIVYAPYFRMDRIAPLPADADSKTYKLNDQCQWEDYSVQAQAAKAKAAQDAADKATADAQEARAEADSAKQTAMQLLMAQASALPDKGGETTKAGTESTAETGADTSNESTSSTPNTDTSSTTTPDAPTDSAENKEA